MKIAQLADVPLVARKVTPFAVAINEEIRMFSRMTDAHDYATMALEAQGNRKVNRFVALVEPEYNSAAPIQGWRAVTYFNLEGSLTY